MEERLKLISGWYLRTVAFIYVFMFIPISFWHLSQNSYWVDYTWDLRLWYFKLPLFDRVAGYWFEMAEQDYFYLIPIGLIPYLFWSFWIITLLRWITTGKHFWQ